MNENVLSLKQWRVVKDKTQEEVAEHIGVHINTFRRWEKNYKLIPLGYMLKIAEYLDVRLNNFDFFCN